MALAPLAHKVGCGAAAGVNLANDLDGGGDAGGGCHMREALD